MKKTTAVLLAAGLIGLAYYIKKKRDSKKTVSDTSQSQKKSNSNISIKVTYPPDMTEFIQPWSGPELSRVTYAPKL